jgi:hypothetical protein
VNPNLKNWELQRDGSGPMIMSQDITLAMSNSVDYEIKTHRKTIDQAFRLMVRAPQMDEALRAWVAYDEDESDVEPKGGITKVRAMIRKALGKSS